ncbi:MAG: integrin alpha, partial [Candidatus Omnitrophica bacterium]|nr:integrin alpha [Candidatus Omnitrophota bacterium]
MASATIVVGAPYYDLAGCYNEGRIYVYTGSSSGVGTSPFWHADSAQDYALLGYSVGSAGYVNDDQYGDIIAGAPYYDDNNLTDNGV